MNKIKNIALLIAACFCFAGCQPEVKESNTENMRRTIISDQNGTSYNLIIVEKDGYKFAVLTSGGHCSMVQIVENK